MCWLSPTAWCWFVNLSNTERCGEGVNMYSSILSGTLSERIVCILDIQLFASPNHCIYIVKGSNPLPKQMNLAIITFQETAPNAQPITC